MKSGKRLKSMQIFVVASIVLLALIITVLCVGFLMRYEVHTDVSSIGDIPYWTEDLPREQQVWYQRGIEELSLALKMHMRKKYVKNVIIFVATGFSTDALAVARFWDGRREARLLSWDQFPHLGRLKNSCSHTKVCDPLTVATALYGGVKTNFKVAGLDATVDYQNCTAAAYVKHHVKSILRQAQEVGLRTGFVTTQRVTGSTTAALYAHLPDTSWECEVNMPREAIAQDCRDTARQLLKSETGKRLNVIMGGGRQTLVSSVPITEWDPIDEQVCNSFGKRNLIRDWQTKKLLEGERYAVLQNSAELRLLNGSAVDYVMGIFANGDLRPLLKEPQRAELTPKLVDMVDKAIQVLKRDKAGHILLVETGVKTGSSIPEQVEELLAFNNVIEHTLNGNSSVIGDDILSLVVFTNGNYVKNVVDSSAISQNEENLRNPTDDDDFLDGRLRNILTDTMVYAKGPKAYLFHGIHEETYMAHAISYALQMGQFHKNT